MQTFATLIPYGDDAVDFVMWKFSVDLFIHYFKTWIYLKLENLRKFVLLVYVQKPNYALDLFEVVFARMMIIIFTEKGNE